MLLIYVPYKTSRIEYVWNFIFNEVVKVHYRLTSSVDEFNQYYGPKLEYSNKKTQNTLWLWASNLLNQNGLNKDFTENKYENWGNVLFPSENTASFLPFDLPSAVFWLISRYEEYIANDLDFDIHGRYNYEKSWLYQRNLLEKPIVNLWIMKFAQMLKQQYSFLNVEKSKYNFVSTIDIDNMYACKGKPFLLNIGGALKALFYGRYGLSWNRFTYWLSNYDMYETYSEILKMHQEYNIKPIFFVLTSKKSLYDRNLLPKHPLFFKTVNLLIKDADIGIHLSYSGHEQNTFNVEKNTLESLLKRTINKNRFHYLKFRLPNSYQKLFELGISSDYSMMYSQIKGFRAGTCSPFYFFNLYTNEPINVKIYSSPFMDRHLMKNSLSKEKLLSEIISIIEIIKNLGGTFVLLWHNETISEKMGQNFDGKLLYKQILEHAVS